MVQQPAGVGVRVFDDSEAVRRGVLLDTRLCGSTSCPMLKDWDGGRRKKCPRVVSQEATPAASRPHTPPPPPSGALPSRHHRSRGPKKTGLPARKATAGSPLGGRASASPSLLARRHLPLWWWPTDPGCEGPDSSPPSVGSAQSGGPCSALAELGGGAPGDLVLPHPSHPLLLRDP
jgi:hypothetical protein